MYLTSGEIVLRKKCAAPLDVCVSSGSVSSPKGCLRAPREDYTEIDPLPERDTESSHAHRAAIESPAARRVVYNQRAIVGDFDAIAVDGLTVCF